MKNLFGKCALDCCTIGFANPSFYFWMVFPYFFPTILQKLILLQQLICLSAKVAVHNLFENIVILILYFLKTPKNYVFIKYGNIFLRPSNHEKNYILVKGNWINIYVYKRCTLFSAKTVELKTQNVLLKIYKKDNVMWSF
jgi:hypothetical protein